jgi:hypothetical protein
METTEQKRTNPLTSLMRQPKLYVRLPSKGRFWPEGSLSDSPNGEYAVYSMTAKDEMLIKTPDALMNGQAVVDVIQNCIPGIINAWHTPTIDLDVILVAIKMATYGPTMDMGVKIGEEELNYGVNLRDLLVMLYDTITWEEKIDVGEHLALYIKPLSYQTINQINMKNFETQRLMSVLNDTSLSEEQKIDMFRESFAKLTTITVGIIHDSVYKIDSSQGSTDNEQDIKEFLENCDKEIFDAIKNKIDQLKTQNSLKPIRVKSTPEMIAAGAKEETEIPLIFDHSSFFA